MGRFPSNLIHDASPEVLAEFAKAGESKSIRSKRGGATNGNGKNIDYGEFNKLTGYECGYQDAGSPARFFQSCPFTEEDYAPFIYQAKASRSERGEGNNHPTVKSLSLMRYLCRLITPPGGLILDPFAGSGTTCLAAKQEGFRFIGIEKEPEYAEIARRRIATIPTGINRWVEGARQC